MMLILKVKFLLSWPKKLEQELDKEIREKKNEIKASEDRLMQRESNIDKRDELTDGYVAKDGYDYYVFEFEFKNISDTEKHVYYGCFGCYADGVWVEQTYNYDGIIKGNLVDDGDKTKGTVAFMVPENAKLVEMIFQYICYKKKYRYIKEKRFSMIYR